MELCGVLLGCVVLGNRVVVGDTAFAMVVRNTS